MPAVHDAQPEHYELWKDIEVNSIPKNCVGIDRDEAAIVKIDGRAFSCRPEPPTALLLGGADLAGLAVVVPRRRGGDHRRHAGQRAADADRAAGFCRRRAGRRRDRARRHPDHRSNLKRCGLFAPIDPAAYIEKIVNVDAVPRFPDWRTINAQALVTGRVTRQNDGRLKAEFRLWDVFAGQQLAGQQYFTTPDNWRRIAHIISDAIYERLTGEKGYFDSRVVFVDETGPRERRIKRLAIMDQDGANVRYLTRGDDLVLTPRFSPSTQEITYMAYGQGDPRVYLLNIDTDQREIVGNFPGMSFSPRFSPDGQRVIMSLQQGSNSNLFVMDLRSKATTRLTDTPAIDTVAVLLAGRLADLLRVRSRRPSADLHHARSRRRGAAHQLRRRQLFDAGVVAARRLHRLHRQAQGKFAIGVMKPDGSGERILTEGFHNEGPTFAPNGRVIMFFRDGRGAGPSLFTIDVAGRNEQRCRRRASPPIPPGRRCCRK